MYTAAGSTAECDSPSDDSSDRESTWRARVLLNASVTTVDFGAVGTDSAPPSADFSTQSIKVALERRFFERLSVQVGAGALDGTVSSESSRHDIQSGWTAAASSSYRLFDAEGVAPFVVPGFDLSFVHAATVDRDDSNAPLGGLEALDLRFGALVGARVFDLLRPYAGARYSGGPVRWKRGGNEEQGIDRRQYEVPLGMLVGPVSSRGLGPITGIDGYIEGVVLGQRGVTLGVGYGF